MCVWEGWEWEWEGWDEKPGYRHSENNEVNPPKGRKDDYRHHQCLAFLLHKIVRPFENKALESSLCFPRYLGKLGKTLLTRIVKQES